ncbi:hypothetical protein [Vogesella indigofera]|uniref:Uncharacterized protein n=1 Tax=Vogesella indigofera TaxID=45465 RepID=A0ABT5I8Y3_VOGIN|nr:hypothetical protein [Vogesella indigofera]MDC7692646.1 hypothetical protein [Vogesella indigofera]
MEFLIGAALVLGWLWFRSRNSSGGKHSPTHSTPRDNETLIPFPFWLDTYQNAPPPTQALMASMVLFQTFHVVANSPDVFVDERLVEQKLSDMSLHQKKQLVDMLVLYSMKMSDSILDYLGTQQARVAFSIIVISWTKETKRHPVEIFDLAS